MSDLFGGTLPIDHAAQLAEVEREIALRRRVYPKWTEAGRLSEAAATRQIETMTAVLRSLYEVEKLRREVKDEHRRGMMHAATVVASAMQRDAAETIRRAVVSTDSRAAAGHQNTGDRT